MALIAAAAVAAGGVELIAGSGIGAFGPRPAVPLESVITPSATSSRHTAAMPSASEGRSPGPGTPAGPTLAAGRTTTAVGAPTRLQIPALGVDAPIVSEGIDNAPGDRGGLAVPADVRQTGWWDGGPSPGQPGVAVIAGHRSSVLQGVGALWRLPTVEPGTRVGVTEADGYTSRWAVDAVEEVVKSDLPASLWARAGPPRLALVTCGGRFDMATGHYVDNVIIWAVPAPSI
jgi:hypothetical protein